MATTFFRNATTVAVAAIALLAAQTPANAQDSSLRVGGSTTLVPAIANAAMVFMDKNESWKQVDPSLPDEQPVIYVTGGGSGFGVKSAINGAVDIGMASRDIKDSEKEALGPHKAYLVGKDAVAFAVEKSNPLAEFKRDLTSEEVREILSGEYRTYKDIDPSLPDTEIVLLVRDAGGGSAEIVQEKIMGDAQISPGALQMPSQGALLKKLASNPNAFGYISAGLAGESDDLIVFGLDGVEPSHRNVVSGSYKLARPLLMIVKGETPSPTAKAFIDYVLADGQTSVAAQGYVPLHDTKVSGLPQ